MPLTSLLPWIMTAIVASIAAMVSGVAAGWPVLSWIASGLFTTALIAVAVDVNRPWWLPLGERLEPDMAVMAAIRNARLMMLGYLWGSLALIFVYRMTGLRWQHGLQYASAMALVAWLIIVYVHFVARPGSILRRPSAMLLATRLTLAHAAAALAGTTFLLTSGKIFSTKGDWAANQVFLAGGIAVVALSLISAYTQFRLGTLSRREPHPGVGANTA